MKINVHTVCTCSNTFIYMYTVQSYILQYHTFTTSQQNIYCHVHFRAKHSGLRAAGQGYGNQGLSPKLSKFQRKRFCNIATINIYQSHAYLKQKGEGNNKPTDPLCTQMYLVLKANCYLNNLPHLQLRSYQS